jgi:Zn-finger nucleic acid-binding protein
VRIVREVTYGMWHLTLVCPDCRKEVNPFRRENDDSGKCPHCGRIGIKAPGFIDATRSRRREKMVAVGFSRSRKWWKRVLGLWDWFYHTEIQEVPPSLTPTSRGNATGP